MTKITLVTPKEYEKQLDQTTNLYSYTVKQSTVSEIELSEEQSALFEQSRQQIHQQMLVQVAKAKRDSLLSESDKLVLADRWENRTAEEKEKISQYRQALRDIPQQPGFPENIEWPVLSLD